MTVNALKAKLQDRLIEATLTGTAPKAHPRPLRPRTRPDADALDRRWTDLLSNAKGLR